MKFFTNKSIWSKIVIALVIVLIFQFIVAKPSLGKVEDSLEMGGKLMAPIVSLGVTLADAVFGIMQNAIMSTSTSLLQVDTADTWFSWLKTALTVVIAAVAVISFLSSAGLLTIVAAGVAAACFGGTAWGLYSSAIDSFANGAKSTVCSFFGVEQDVIPDTVYLPVYSISPEEIFQNKILLFNVDFFGNNERTILEHKNSDGEIEYYYYNDEDTGEEVKTSKQDIGADLQPTISKWYVALRNIGLVMMLIVLLYVGIRMLLSTVASDKAKYKQMLQDWIMGVVILFSIHYIMVFANVIVNSLTRVVGSSVEEKIYTVAMQDKDNGKLTSFIEDENNGFNKDEYITEVEGKKIVNWPTNLMGSLRLRAQLANWGTEYIGYAICFIVLVIFTAFFIITYMKRVLYMAFLTLMAPLVAVTYPIDKLNDGKAQGFDKWFKEYIFNLLIQPLHLLLYYILVTSAFELAGTNVVYALVAIGFMIPAEKILRGFFGFEKSSTAPSMATGAALGMGIAHAFKPKPPKFGGNGAKGIGGGSSDPSTTGIDAGVKTSADKDIDTNARMAVLAGGNGTDNSNSVTDINGGQNDDNIDNTEGSPKPIQAELLDVDGSKIGDVEVTENGLNNNKPEGGLNTTDKALQDNEPKENKTIKRPTLKGGKMHRYAASKAERVKANLSQGIRNAPGSALRGFGKFAGATFGATVGLAAGIAQGDLGKAMTNVAASGATGAMVGKGMANGVANGIDRRINAKFPTETPDQAYNRVYGSAKFDDLAKQEAWKKQRKELQQSMITNGMSKAEAKEFTKKGGDAEYLWYNSIQDNKQLMAAYETKKENYEKLSNEEKQKIKTMSPEARANRDKEELKDIVATAKTAKEMGDGYKGTKARKWEKEWAQRVQENGSITNPEQATMAGKQIVKRGADFSKKMEKYR